MKKLVYLLFLLPMLMVAQTTTENYVKKTTYKVKTLNGTTKVTGGSLVANDKSESITYFDGLGRAKQSVAVRAGGQAQDIVSFMIYDEFGRQTKEYLPFANGSNNLNIRTGDLATNANQFYQTKYPEDFAGVSLPNVNAYSEKVLENSPLNRVFEQAAPGKDWAVDNGHTIKFVYDTNIASEVKIYSVTTAFANNTYTPVLQGGISNYNEGQLYKTITKDENWKTSDGVNHTTEEFKNKQGQVILKRTYYNSQKHDTYYVYDDYGNLTYVLPPKAEANIDKPDSTELSELCYQYTYDNRNRLIEKKIPGKGKEYIVYNLLDQPVLSQDTNLKTQNKWLLTKYDALGRIAFTGIHNSSNLRVQMQQFANNEIHNYSQFINRTNSQQTLAGTPIYYNNTSMPYGIYEVHTINYYDTYVDLPSGLTPTVITSFGVTSTTNTKGLPTVSKVRILETSDWITTVTYYDEKTRPIYLFSKNDYLNTIDIVESKLDDFTGKVLETKTTHKKTGKADLVTIDRFEYDHTDRLLSQTQKVNNQISERIVRNNYDELGQLASKLIGNGTKKAFKNKTWVSVVNDVITKTNGTGWSAGLATESSFTNDGYVSFVPTQVNKYYMVGLSYVNSNASYSSIKYAIYVRDSKNVYIYESGSNRGLKTTYEYGDVLKVERIGNTVYYKKNEQIFYTSAVASSGSLLGDTSLYHTGGKIKDLHIVDNNKGLQKVDYKYNIRGWLRGINDNNTSNASVTLASGDLFGFEINYNNPTDANKALYNGNISQTLWKTSNPNNPSGNSISNKYTYSYDALNRITGAIDNTSNYNLSNVTYDKNGNIKTLKRQGLLSDNPLSNDFNVLDNLVYTYDNGNKLKKVLDNGNDNFGFKDGINTTTEYTYDANGNMVKDDNKGITNIQYNHLNLPTNVAISGQNIDYVYDANGVKLRKTAESNVTDYAGNTIYKNNTLQFFNHAEGYVQNNSGTFSYVYQYKDHLGNVRLSYTDNNNDGAITPSSEIVEESNYYPFGLKHKGYNNVTSSNGNSTAQKFGYVERELEESLDYNMQEMDWRHYDPAIGRFVGIDKMSENFQDKTPYHYSNNNPIIFKDPTGLFSTVVNEDGIVLDHQDDGDNNVYLNNRFVGMVVGKEDPNKDYKKGDKYTYHNGKQDFNWDLFGLGLGTIEEVVLPKVKDALVYSSVLVYDDAGKVIGRMKFTRSVPFKALKMVGGVLKPIGVAGSALGAISDLDSYLDGEITGVHYSYKVGGMGASIYAASAYGGLAGLTVGGVVYMGDLFVESAIISHKLSKETAEQSQYKINSTNIFSKSFWNEAASFINPSSFRSGFSMF